MPHLGQSRRQFFHAFRHPDQGPHGITQRRRLDQALERADKPRIVLAQRATPATDAANLPLRQRFRVEIILAAIDSRTRQPSDLRNHRKAAPTGGPRLGRRKQSTTPLIELRADRFPSLPNGLPVDHAIDLHPCAARRNPQHPNHYAA